jgi:hypothetical protein
MLAVCGPPNMPIFTWAKETEAVKSKKSKKQFFAIGYLFRAL